MKKLLLVVAFLMLVVGTAVPKEKKQAEPEEENEHYEYTQLLGMWRCGGYQNQIKVHLGVSAIEINYVDMMGNVYQESEFMRYMGSSESDGKLIIRTTGRTLRITKISDNNIKIDGFSECTKRY